MELREFFAIFVIHKKIFWIIIISFMICGIVFYFVQEQTYMSSLTLNITRNVAVESDEYNYDNFYRLQADERFADTVVRWTQAPHLIEQIFENKNNAVIFIDLKNFHAKRLSSQVIDVTFVTTSKKDAEFIAKKLIRVLNEESQKLNAKQKQDNWFIILGSDSVVSDNNRSLVFLLGISAFLGFFVAFWAVMLRHYMIGSNKT